MGNPVRDEGNQDDGEPQGEQQAQNLLQAADRDFRAVHFRDVQGQHDGDDAEDGSAREMAERPQPALEIRIIEAEAQQHGKIGAGDDQDKVAQEEDGVPELGVLHDPTRASLVIRSKTYSIARRTRQLLIPPSFVPSFIISVPGAFGESENLPPNAFSMGFDAEKPSLFANSCFSFSFSDTDRNPVRECKGKETACS